MSGADLDRRLARELGDGPAPARPWSARALPWCAVALGLAAPPLALLSDLAGAFREYLPSFSLPALLGMSGFLFATLVTGGLALGFRRAWGWWLVAIGALGGVAYHAKLVLPVLLHLKWGHARAPAVLRETALAFGLPLAAYALVGVLCVLPAVRADADRAGRTARRRVRRR